jgi:hypothetical protein
MAVGTPDAAVTTDRMRGPHSGGFTMLRKIMLVIGTAVSLGACTPMDGSYVFDPVAAENGENALSKPEVPAQPKDNGSQDSGVSLSET